MRRMAVLLAMGVSFFLVSCSEDNFEPTQIILYDAIPAGGPPGTMISLIGRHFGSLPEEHTVRIGNSQTEVISVSDTLLTIQIPPSTVFAKLALVVSRPGLQADSLEMIISENPLAEVNSLQPVSGPVGTIVTVVGSHFNPDEDAYAILYEEPDGTFLMPENNDGTYRSTVEAVYTDSLILQIPEGFQQGRIRILTSTVGEPTRTAYELFTPVFTVQ